MRISKPLAAVAVTAALGLAAVPVLAQEEADATESQATVLVDSASDDDASDGSASVDGESDRMADRAARRAQVRDEFAAALAAELGLDPAEVADAVDTVIEDRRAAAAEERAQRRQERLAEAVEDGRITQEEADALANLAGDERIRRLGDGRGGHGHHRGAGPYGLTDDAAASDRVDDADDAESEGQA